MSELIDLLKEDAEIMRGPYTYVWEDRIDDIVNHIEAAIHLLTIPKYFADDDGYPITPNDAFKKALNENELFKALHILQAIDSNTLVGYLSSPDGQAEIDRMLRDLVVFEAKTDMSFLRGLMIGIAITNVDYDVHGMRGYSVMPALRAGLAMLRNRNIDVVTGREHDFHD